MGTGSLGRRGEMESKDMDKTGWWCWIVLHPDPICGVRPCLRFHSCLKELREVTWRITDVGRVQSAFLWRQICGSGSQVREFLRKAQNARCNYWMPAYSSRNHARAGGIEKAVSASRRGAATSGTDTRRESLGGVSAGGSLTP